MSVISSELPDSVVTSGEWSEWYQALSPDFSIAMVHLPQGEFVMGSDAQAGHREECPAHRVSLASFSIGKYPVTQDQWEIIARWPKVVRELNPQPANFLDPNRPVENITWLDGVEFCVRLSMKTGKLYRLPTEAEWEYACRAGTTTDFVGGDRLTLDVANYRPINPDHQSQWREQTTPVGQFSPNGFGLYDCHGNVWEWCGDRWHDTYENAPLDGCIWDESLNQDYSTLRLKWLHSRPNHDRVLRGGSWYSSPTLCRSAARYHLHPYDQYTDFIGMRLVCGPMQGSKAKG